MMSRKKIFTFLRAIYLILPNFITHNKLVMQGAMLLVRRLKKPLAGLSACCELEWFYKNFYKKNDILPGIEYSGVVDIIIPVYNGFEHLNPLFESLFRNTDVAYNLIIINDASTDGRVKCFLDNIAEGRSNIRIFQNEKNYGFVKTVNKAFSFTRNHVVILNTDVIVPKDWLSRLIYPLVHFRSVASATPLTNAGTICSFPTIFENNDLIFALQLEDIDAEYRRIKVGREIFIETPAGVGFCMAISKQALHNVGKFNEKDFGFGYGEEVDWCLRAKNKEFTNVIVTNLYVYHKHGGSFAENTKKKLMLEHSKIISRKYPKFMSLVYKSAENTAYEKIRSCLLLLLAFKKARQRYLIFDHSLGGGASFYIDDFIKSREEDAFLLVRYIFGKYKVTLLFQDYKIDFMADDRHDLFLIFDYIKIDIVILNEVYTYPLLNKLFESLVSAKKRHYFLLKMIIHDFYSICPSFTLLDYTQEWCAGGDPATCKKCFKKLKYLYDETVQNIKQWREMWLKLFIVVDEFLVFSESTKKLFLSIYDIERNKIKLEQMAVVKLTKVNKIRYSGDKDINIGVIGSITFQKGAKILWDMAKIISANSKYKHVRLIIIGKIDEKYKHSKMKILGSYERENLSYLVAKHEIDLIFIPSILGETFSYTTSEAMEMGLPIAVFDLGAQAEKIRKYKKGVVIKEINAAVALDAIMRFYRVNNE
jgi:GT2 family glycosyltransferase